MHTNTQGRRHRGGRGGSCPPWENVGGAVPPLKSACKKYFGKTSFSFIYNRFTNLSKFSNFEYCIYFVKKRLVKIMNSEKGKFVYTNISSRRS